MTGPAVPTSDDIQALHDTVARRMADERTAAGFPTERLDAIDAAVRRRTVRNPDTKLSGRLRALEQAADIDTDPPVASDQRGGRGVKVAVAKLTGWYVGHLAAQVRDLGGASVRAMRAVAARIDELERRMDAVEEQGDAEVQP